MLSTRPLCRLRAPRNWGARREFLRIPSAASFQNPDGHLRNECFAMYPKQTAHNATNAINEFAQLPGIELSPTKTYSPFYTAPLLGDGNTLSHGRRLAEIAPRRAHGVTVPLYEIPKPYKLSPAVAAKLRGRLGCARSLLLSRFAGASMHPFTRKQYKRSTGRPLLPAELRRSAQWRSQDIDDNVPRATPYKIHGPIVSYSEAFVVGRIGISISL